MTGDFLQSDTILLVANYQLQCKVTMSVIIQNI